MILVNPVILVNLVNLAILVDLAILVNPVILVTWILVNLATLTHRQDHVLSENIWFAWSKTSCSGDKRRCHQAGQATTNEQGKVGLLSPWAVGRLSFAI